MKLNIIDKILIFTFRKYTYKIYCIGLSDGFEWANKIT